MATIASAAQTVVGLFGYPGVQPEKRYAPEGITQTFKAGVYLINSSGNLVITTSNAAAIIGVATRDGQNTASAALKNSEFVVAHPGLLLELNLLTAGSTHVLAVGDLWTACQYTLTGNFIVGDTTTSTPRILPVQFPLDIAGQNQRGVVGDTNARVYAVLLGSAVAQLG